MKEALKLALEALDDLSRYADLCELLLKETHPAKAFALRERVTNSIKTITAIKEALAQPTSGDYALGYSIGFGEGHSAGKSLAQPEQEPVALKPCGYESAEKKMCRKCGQVHAEAIWDTTPPQRKPLDMTEIVRLTYDIDEDKPATMAELFCFARAIEAAHGIKE